jgi:hypothetical protein
VSRPPLRCSRLLPRCEAAVKVFKAAAKVARCEVAVEVFKAAADV